jgi:hypothetical protein
LQARYNPLSANGGVGMTLKFQKLLGRVCLSVFFLNVAARADDAPPPIRQFDIPTIEKLGLDMYTQDQEVWKATDIMRAQHSDDDLRAQTYHGWIVETVTGKEVVRFIDDGANSPEAFCDVAFTPDPASACVAPQDRALNSVELAQYNARHLALKNVERPCSDRYNTVALRDPQGDGWLVWALAATTEPGVEMNGGHYRFTISPDGNTISKRDALSRGCLKTPPPSASKGKLMFEVRVQLVSNIPVETEVWQNLQTKTPIMLITPDRTEWLIDKGSVTVSGQLSEKPKS